MVECQPRELACLYLAAYPDAGDRSPASPAVTAAGIGDALELGDTAASRVKLLDDLAALEADGLLTSDERPVTGFGAPRTVYTLTDAGHEHAAAIRRRVTEESVEVTNGTRRRVSRSTSRRRGCARVRPRSPVRPPIPGRRRSQ